MNDPTGNPIRFAPAGEKPPDVAGCVWVDQKNPHAGSAEADWQWVLYVRSGGMQANYLNLLPPGVSRLDLENYFRVKHILETA